MRDTHAGVQKRRMSPLVIEPQTESIQKRDAIHFSRPHTIKHNHHYHVKVVLHRIHGFDLLVAIDRVHVQ